MSAAGIYATSLATHFPIDSSTSTQPHNNLSFREDLGQLGQDLESGNLSAAQQDFATLQLDGPQASSNLANPNAATSISASSTTTAQSNNPITQAVNQLAVDLQSGNLSAAQQDYTNLQQDVQDQTQSGTPSMHFHHERHTGGVNELFDQLGQQLQSSNLSTAQQTYGSLLQNAPFAQSLAAPASNGVSISI